MKQSTKLILGIAAFALLLVGAMVAYNALSGQVQPDIDIPVTQTQALGDEKQEAAITQEQFQGEKTQPEQTQSPANPDNTQTQTRSAENWNGTDFTVTDAAGNAVKLSDLRGKPVVLNFWASWCPPCRQEMPEFDKVYGEMGGDIQFMMVALTDGARETVATASKFVGDSGYGFPVYFDTLGQAANAYGIRSIPATYFIDSAGKVVSSQVGALSEAALRRGIAGIG